MDPLSITLAVVTLATALKDIIETANAIQDSFSKLPQNYQNAQRLSKQVLKTLQEMQEIYQEKKQVFDGSSHLRNTINDLRLQMKSVHEKCARLIPPVSERKRDRFKIAFYSFWSRDKVEKLISDLYRYVDRCSQQFILLSSLRTEALVVEIHKTLHNAVHSSGHGAVQTQIASGYSSFKTKMDAPQSGMIELGIGSVSNAHLFEFNRSSTTPMTWIPDTIPTHDLSRAYLRRELGRIDLSLQSISTRWLMTPPTEVEIPILTISWFLENSPMPNVIVHQHAVMFAYRIQSLLLQSPSNEWVHAIDLAINQLCINLNDLHMWEDVIALCTLRIDMWRAIMKRYPSRTSSRRLVEALTKLSVVFTNIGDQSRAYMTTGEAIQILESLVGVDEPNLLLKMQDVEVLARNMILQADNEPDNEKSLQLAVEAGRILGSALGIDDISAMDISSSDWAVISSSSTAIATIFSENISDDTRFTYASSLLRIAQVQLNHHQTMESNKFAKIGLAILNHLLTIYPDSDKIQDELTRALTHLSAMTIRTLNTVAENVEYTERNTRLIRQLGQINPQRYVIPLANALWSQREVLLVFGRQAEAQKIYQEMVSLNELAAAPAHLDLKIPSQTEGDYYSQVALCHYTTQRFMDAVFAAQNAISQYSSLEFMEPGRSRAKHISALALLCKSLTAARQYEAALTEGFKALAIIDKSYIKSSEFDLVESYREVLGALIDALEASSGPDALRQAEDIINRIRKLARSGKVKSKWKSAQAPVKYAKLLQKNGMIEEAVTYLQEMRNNWKEMFGDLDDTVMAIPYIQCLMELPQILKDKGETDRALHYNEEALAFTERFFGEGPNEFKSVVLGNMKSTHVYLLCDAGRYPEAMELGLAMASNIRKAPQMMQDTRAVIQSLFGVALTQVYNCQPSDAIATATEASLYCERLPNDNPHKFTLLYACQLNLSNAYADLGNVDQAINHLDNADRAIQRQNKVYSTEDLEAAGESAYSTILIRRSRMLFAKGDYVEAAVLVKKVEAIERDNSKMTQSSLKDLANVLLYSGVLYCNLGRHEEGIAAATELAELQKSLASSPALGRLLKVGLNFLTKRGGWKPVKEVKDRLTCGHQDREF